MKNYLLLLFILAFATPSFAGVYVLDDAEHAAPFLKAADARVLTKLPADLRHGDVVVITAASVLSRTDEQRLREFVRSGGGLLVTHTDADNCQILWEKYHNSPIEAVLPAVFVPKGVGIENYYGRTRLAEAAGHPVTAGIDFSARPRVEFHTPVVLPTDPMISRHLLWPVLGDNILKSMISGDWTPIIWGDDAERRCLLAVGRYGAGRTAFMGVDYASPTLAEWAFYPKLMANLTEWLTSGASIPVAPAEPKVLALAVDTPTVHSLRRMGFDVVTTAVPADAAELAAVVIGDMLPDDKSEFVADYLRKGGNVITLSPQALKAEPLRKATGSAIPEKPLLSQVWKVSEKVGGAFATRRPPRLAFGGIATERFAAARPIMHGRGGWGFFATCTGFVFVPADGGGRFALMISGGLSEVKVDGRDATLTDPPDQLKAEFGRFKCLPLKNLTPGRHELQMLGAAITGQSVRLVDLSAPASAPDVVATANTWQYHIADEPSIPKIVPQLPADDWQNGPPQTEFNAQLPPILIELPEPPPIALPETWRFKQVGDYETDIDLVEKWFSPDFDDSQWKTRTPGPLTREINGRQFFWSQYNGAVWYRAKIAIPAAATESGGFLLFRSNHSHITAYVNGKMTGSWPGAVAIPLSQMQPGENAVAVRVWARPAGIGPRWELDGLTSVSVERGTVHYKVDRENVGITQQWFKQLPPADAAPQTLALSGRQNVEQINWVWITLEALPGVADTQLHTVGPDFMNVWLNGEAICTDDKVQTVTIPNTAYKPGRNTIVVRKFNAPGWNRHPGIELKFTSGVAEDLPSWAKGAVTLPKAAAAIRIGKQPAKGLLYVDGKPACPLTEGIFRLSLSAGEHQLAAMLSDGGNAPAVEFIAEARQAAAIGRWQQHRASPVPPRIDDAAWQQITTQNGALRRFKKRDDSWYAGTFTLDATQAAQAVMLHFTTNEAVSVEPGLVKELWINGQRITATERKHAEELNDLVHKTTTFDLTGKLRPGENAVVFRPDFARYKGLDLPVPSDAPWMIPLPQLEIGSDWLMARLDGALSRHQPPDHYRRIGFDTASLPGGRPLTRWADGEPLFLQKQIGGGTLIAAASDLNRFIRPSITWDDWGGEQNDMEGGALAGNGTYSVNRQDDTQILAGLLRSMISQPKTAVAAARGIPGKKQVQIDLRNLDDDQQRILAVRVLSWERTLLYSAMMPVTLPRGETTTVAIDLSNVRNYFGNWLKDELFVRTAVLTGDGTTVLDYVDRTLDTTPPVTVNLSTDDPSERDLPLSVANAPQYKKLWAKWEPADEALPAYIYLPGETAHLHAAIKNQTDQPKTVSVQFELAAQLSGSEKNLGQRTIRLAPHEQQWMTFEQPLNSDFEAFEFTASWSIDENSADKPDRLSTRTPFSVIRPFKKLRDVEKFMVRGGFGLHGPGAGLNNVGVFEGPIFDVATIYGATSTELEWWKLDSLIEAPGNGGGFGTPQITNDFYWGMFDRGPQSGRSALDNSSFFPSGERYWEWMSRHQRQAIRAACGSVPTGGSLADWWVQLTMHAVPRNVVEFAQWAEVNKGYTITAKTIAELHADLKAKYPNEWQDFFNTDAATKNTELSGVSMSPGSFMWSQLDWAGPALGMLNGQDWAKIAGRWFSCGEPDNCLRRVFIGERFRAYLTAAGRALSPAFNLSTHHGHEPGTNNNAYSWPHAQGGVGIWPAEVYSRALHDWIWLQVVGEDGSLQPLTNMPSYKNEGRLSLFGGVMGYSTGTLAEWQLFDRAFTLMNYVGAEKALGAAFVVSPERPHKGPAVPGNYHAGEWTGNIGTKTMNDPVRNLWETLRNYGAVITTFSGPYQAAETPASAIVYAMPNDLSDREVSEIAHTITDGKGFVGLYTTGGNQQKETQLSDLFGVKYTAAPQDAEFSVSVSPLARSILGDDLAGATAPVPDSYTGPNYRRTANAGSDLLNLPDDRVGVKVLTEGNRRAAFSGLYGQNDWGADHDLARVLARTVNWAAGNPIIFDDGLTGMGFEAEEMTFVVVEELHGLSGSREIRVKLPPAKYRAVNLVDNLPVESAGNDGGYLVLKPSIRPLEAMLIAIRPVN